MKIISFVFLFLLSYKCFPQNSLTFGVDFSISSTKYYDNGAYDAGALQYGVSSEYIRKLSLHHGLSLFTGYDLFKDRVLKKRYLDYIPIRFGYHYFSANNKILFFTDAGIGILIDKYNKSTTTGLNLSAGTGYKLSINNSQFLQFAVIFNYVNSEKFTNDGWLFYRMAYGFNLSKKNK